MTQASKKILVVEDDLALNDAFGMMLKFAGYESENVFNGAEALEKLKTYQPDLIILDILMPVMGGREFLEKFDNVNKIPILVLSNLDTKDDIREILSLGADDYMLKSSASPQTLPGIIDKMIVPKKGGTHVQESGS